MSILPPVLFDGEANDDAWRAEVCGELRHIREAVDDLTESLKEFRAEVNQRLEEHKQYHSRAEPYWGPVRWCERHPFRVAGFAAVAATCATTWGGSEWLQAIIPLLMQVQ